MPESPWRYWAFISYSHHDKASAVRLHQQLESYRVPEALVGRPSRDGSVPDRIRPVFRDRDDLQAASVLDDALRAALASSRYLIVVCSPRSAVSAHVDGEVAHFKSLGRADRVLSLIVDGDPRDGSDACAPPALLHAVDAQGQVTDERVEPLFADARPSGDGWRDAILKVVAGLLDVHFDDLRRRELRRQRAATRRRGALVAASVVATCAAYLLACDAGVNLPGANAVRRSLDDLDASLLRRPPAFDAVRSAVAVQRRQTSRALLGSLGSRNLFWDLVGVADESSADPWASSQVISALCRDPEMDDHAARVVSTSLHTMMSDHLKPYEGGLAVWTDPTLVPRGPPALWLATGLAIAIRRTDRFAPDETQWLRESFETMKAVVDRLRTDDTGGWNMFANMATPSQHDTYSTVLALAMLLEEKESGLEHGGGAGTTDGLIRRAAAWLVDCHKPDLAPPGWRRYVIEGDPTTIDGLTLQVDCALLRAEEAGLATLPVDLVESMTRHLIACGDRGLDFPLSSAEFYPVVVEGGVPRRQLESVRFVWHPWAISACARWLRRVDRGAAVPNADLVAVRRTMGHLVLGLRDASRDEYIRQGGLTFRSAEYLFNLSAVTEQPLAPGARR